MSGYDGRRERVTGIGLERLVFFTDAVFAIAGTLLALELRLPASTGDTERAVSHGLVDVLPRLFSFLLSFFVIALYWLAHWRRFNVIVAADENLARLNFGLLVCVALIPFPTRVLGEHGDQPAAVVLYAAVIAMTGVFSSLSWVYANGNGLVSHGRSARWVRLNTVRGLAVPAVFVATIPVALISPSVAEWSWLLVFPLQAAIVRMVRQAA
jgi:uncharacterized membrane protein